MLVEKSKLDPADLIGRTVIITGGGGGIATEAGRALAYLGANVVLAELDEQRGLAAQQDIGTGWRGRIVYHPLDLVDSQSIARLSDFVIREFGHADAIIHNATITPLGSVEDLPVSSWDTSYLVHLKGPLELTRRFLPGMRERDYGTIVFNPSSGAIPFMGAYEVFKGAQVILANTLAAELENTKVHVFSIGPGLVKTKTATEAIAQIAPWMGMSLDEFYAVNADSIVSAEEAGTSFAVSLLLAEKYHGNEIGGIQALMDAGIIEKDGDSEQTQACDSYSPQNEEILARIGKTYDEQYEGWRNESLFKRDWILRDFKKQVGRPADEVQQILRAYILSYRDAGVDEQRKLRGLLASLRAYYSHQIEMTHGYVKDAKTRAEWIAIIETWIADIDCLVKS
ncbi:MAG: SDR family oxidoreductase [Coriobacteriia bacterium]|nr:SDR family oxidoreductase [Coriobacteriia bacterium]